jgi:sigma-54 dependent transcriptional regulator, acetoin dehydrogenase operon transcriptional activator AcoR
VNAHGSIGPELHAPIGRPRILFLAAGHDGCQLMAEGLARRYGGAAVEVMGAATAPEPPSPLLVEAMREAGIEIAGLPLRTSSEIEALTFDLVITLGAFATAARPALPSLPPHDHWDVPAVAPGVSAEQALEQLRRVRDEMAQKLAFMLASGLPGYLAQARVSLELVLGNLAHAVMAHTVGRRIVYFNREAERITGYRSEEVLGKDCHSVFRPQRFCGGDCLYCSDPRASSASVATRTSDVRFAHRDGKERVLGMTIQPLPDSRGDHCGALVSFQDNTEPSALKPRVQRSSAPRGLVGRDRKMLALFDQIREVAAVNVPVLIQGESGTGKELVANAIHAQSPRARGPFVPINCGALPDGILESELFGHVRGAFTGAVHDKRGRFELADGGTIFLDEVAELSPSMQVKLLRVLQEQCFERVGGERSIQVDVRVVSATNQDLRRLVEKQRFRRDLFYRLCVIPIVMPPLRERSADIPLLVDRFLEQIAAETGRRLKGGTKEALALLCRHAWPGNVRELRNVIEFANVKCRGEQFGVEHLPPELAAGGTTPPRTGARRGPRPRLNRDDVMTALAHTGNNRSEAAKVLGVGRTTLYRHLSGPEYLGPSPGSPPR